MDEKTSAPTRKDSRIDMSSCAAPLMMYPRKTWSTWALSPLWVLQMFLMTNSVLTIGILIFEVEGQGSGVDVGWIVCLAFTFICILLTAGEIGLWFTRALHPWTFLGIQVFKSIFWILYFSVGIATTVMQKQIDSSIVWPFWRIWQAVGLSLSFATTIAALIYGSVVVHRYRRAGSLGPMTSDSDSTIGPKDNADMTDVPWPSRA